MKNMETVSTDNEHRLEKQGDDELLAQHQAKVSLIRRYEQAFLQVGMELEWINTHETFRLAGYATFNAFLSKEFPRISRATAWRWIADAQVRKEVEDSQHNEFKVLDSGSGTTQRVAAVRVVTSRTGDAGGGVARRD